MKNFILGAILGLLLAGGGAVLAQVAVPVQPGSSGFMLDMGNMSIWNDNQGNSGTIMRTPGGMSIWNGTSTPGRTPC